MTNTEHVRLSDASDRLLDDEALNARTPAQRECESSLWDFLNTWISRPDSRMADAGIEH